MRRFWDTAAELHPRAPELDESRRFPIARADRLAELFASAGLCEIKTQALTIPTVFAVRRPLEAFPGGQGPALGYVVSLREAERQRLARALRESSRPTAAASV